MRLTRWVTMGETGIERLDRFMGMTVSEIRAKLQAADAAELAALERSLAADERKGVRQAVETARRRVEAQAAEEARLESLYAFEQSLLPEGSPGIIVGLDEVGRGAVAGPLAVGAVVLPSDARIAGLNDSKQIKPDHREQIAAEIERLALACVVEYIPPADIDRDGMSTSLRRAFAGALAQIEATGIQVDLVLVDGNPLHIDPREKNVVKGDSKCASIAAASIVAKVKRDALMAGIAPEYPAYLFDVNKGYASPQHIEAIRACGLSDMHRRSFCRSFMQEQLF